MPVSLFVFSAQVNETRKQKCSVVGYSAVKLLLD